MTPSPADRAVIRWGILGPGSIAHPFAAGLRELPDAHLTAVGSRDQARADAFGAQFHIPHRHGSYEALAADPDVDVIYVATPHPFHREHCLLALRGGKAVLCEKPFTVNAREAEEVAAEARMRKQFLMEGMWSRFYPIMDRVRSLLREGAIGEVRMVEADFGFRAGFDPKSRLFDPNLGGGALLDVGVYLVSLASMVLGAPDRVTGLATLCATGVDEQAVIALGHPGGALAALSTAITTHTRHRATFLGTTGRITLHPPWWKPERITLVRSGQEDQDVHLPMTGTGFNYEAAEVQRCLRAGLTESPILPLDETAAVMRTMDALRSQWGVKYPMEA